MNQSVVVAIAFGSNLGDREGNIRDAMAMLDRAAQIRVITLSDLFDTEPVGVMDQPRFLNAAALLQTTLHPVSLLHTCHVIERALGRDRQTEQRWGPRTLDLDVLLYGDECVNLPGLKIPHPRMLERDFVLAPLCQIAPAMQIPRADANITPTVEAITVEQAWRRPNQPPS
jgi:2-amino-4-hydroxy-6-hydroxymethyldihydropteridine diphosphokinase